MREGLGQLTSTLPVDAHVVVDLGVVWSQLERLIVKARSLLRVTLVLENDGKIHTRFVM